MQPDDASALVDVAIAARSVLRIVDPLQRDTFRADETAVDAVLYRLVVMGEAVKRLSPAFRQSHPSVRWNAIAGLRDILVHRYDRVDIAEIWDIATAHVPGVLAYIEPLLPTES